ncbi:trypsin-like serine protease [Kitasatospora purpeofusca]|uniref:trypsin-like serine protease n=1 Tax=Kitasatospora purpeofusca TaxID=67352 RepID=UPI002A59C3B5|nr:trypsin-like serine protease [Kitasatospora purpeofusca]MDY0816237.1 trypsin-like serine protease [Kitasatospora purpeofusca]
MPRTSIRPTRKVDTLLAALAAVAITPLTAPSANAAAGDPVPDTWYDYTAQLTIGDTFRTCTGALVDRSWVITAASCFSDDPARPSVGGAPKWRTTVTVGRTDLNATGTGTSTEVVDLVARPDRDLVMAKLATPVDGIVPLRVATAAPVAAETLRAPGYGRTKTEWLPNRLHVGAFTLAGIRPTAVDTTGTGGSAICKGDTGAPVVREVNGRTELVAVASRSWQGGCLGESETRTGAASSRTDDVTGWIQQVRSTTPGWKTQGLVRSGAGLSQTARLADGTWTPFQDIQVAGIGGVKAVAATGIDSNTHVVVLGGDGHLHHTVRHLDGNWDYFGDLNTGVTDLGGITQLAVSSIGADLHVVALADGQLFHSVRGADANWTPFSPVFSATGPLNNITAVAAASSGPDLQLAVIANGVYHTARYENGNWSAWGSVDEAAGAIGPVTSLAMSRQGSDMNLVVVTNTGALYHTVRHQDASWQPFSQLTSIFGQTKATSVSSAPVDGDTQIAVTTTDNRVLLVSRHADTTWSTPQPVDLPGLTGNHTGTAIAGTL